jgi:hypothetical protein
VEADGGAVGHVQVHVAAQVDRAGQEVAGRDEHASAAAPVTPLDRRAERGRAVGGAVTDRAEVGQIEAAPRKGRLSDLSQDGDHRIRRRVPVRRYQRATNRQSAQFEDVSPRWSDRHSSTPLGTGLPRTESTVKTYIR